MHEICMKNGLRFYYILIVPVYIYLEHIFPAFKIKGKRLLAIKSI